MGNAQGHQSAPPRVTAHDRAILDLKVQRDKLRRYQKKLAAVVVQETAVAKHHLANGDKKRALIALKMKKHQESLIEQTDMQLLTLEQMTETIEFALIEQDILEGLKKGNAVLNDIHKEMNLDDVQKLMEDTADAIEYQNEIDEMLSGKLNESDLQDIEDELDALVAQEVDTVPQVPETQLLIATKNPILNLPDVPITELTAATTITKKKVVNNRTEELLPA
ncbi:Vacuolar protein sorting-associated protein 20 [Physocladia obscura]|uniref:Vacuolar protein sorting-associated protein 20 n=1 Tax=Physocladia obscura TaxID=109957 RepID=A0AAD5T2D5_9FUNG|nr:Vacuolar protein sorting-associated protein 20 [Physocladia obscura]